MKKTVLSIATAFSILFATACNSNTTNNEKALAHEEMAHGEMMDEDMLHEEHMEHQEMSNTMSSEALMEVPQFEQIPLDIKTQVQQLTKHYLEIKNALVAGNAAEAQAAATKLLTPLEQFDAATLPDNMQEHYKPQAQSLKEAALAVKNSSDLETQRKQLGQLSQAIYTLNKAFDANEQALYHQYCPMANNNKGGYWLSAEKEVLNPYFGNKMLKCGRVAETL